MFHVQARTTRTAISSGSWTTSSNWSPASAPANPTNSQDDIIIDITGATGINGAITVTGDFELKANTTLTIKACDTLIITGNATFTNGSVLQVDPCAVFIIQGNLTNNNNSDEITVDGALSVGGDFYGGTGSSIDGAGTIEVTGTISGPGTITVIVLSVELIDFNVRLENKKALISWATETESKNESFFIDRSIDGFEWQEIIVSPGIGNSSSRVDYFEIDYQPIYGRSFYRLRQKDFNGQTTVYNPVSFEFYEAIRTVQVMPNLILKDQILVKFRGFRGCDVSIVLMDIHGKICLDDKFLAPSDIFEKSFKTFNFINSGMYILSVYLNDEVYSQRIILQ